MPKHESICPKCTDYRELVPRDFDEGGEQLHYESCAGCRGVWLRWDDLGPAKALRALLPLSSSGSNFQRDQQQGVCPACEPAKALTPLLVGAFNIDRCPDCEGLWFDGGELGPMLTDQGFEALLRTLRQNPA